VEDISFASSNGDVVSLSGVDGGVQKGTLRINSKKTVEITGLTIVSKNPPEGDRKELKFLVVRVTRMQDRIDGVIQEGEHLRKIFIDKNVLETSLKKSQSEEFRNLVGDIQQLFGEIVVALNPERPVSPVRVDGESITASLARSMDEHKAKSASEWIQSQIPEILTELSWSKGDRIKIKHPDLEVTVHCFRDPETGNVSIHIPTGKLAEEESREKNIKWVSEVNHSGVSEVVCASPKKRRKTPEEVKIAREELHKQAQLSQRLDRAGVPNILVTSIQESKDDGGSLHRRYIMEKYDCQLFDVVKEAITETGIDEAKKKEFLQRALLILDALKHMHSQKIVHLDIKLPNILVRGEKTILADFGSAKEANQTILAEEFWVGTPNYIAPEMFKDLEKRVSPKMDMWSVGSMLYELTTGISAFVKHQEKILQEHSSGDFQGFLAARSCLEEYIVKVRKELFETGDELNSLIASLLSLKPNERPSAKEAYILLEKYLSKA